jgi:hypothetical protein
MGKVYHNGVILLRGFRPGDPGSIGDDSGYRGSSGYCRRWRSRGRSGGRSHRKERLVLLVAHAKKLGQTRFVFVVKFLVGRTIGLQLMLVKASDTARKSISSAAHDEFYPRDTI